MRHCTIRRKRSKIDFKSTIEKEDNMNKLHASIIGIGIFSFIITLILVYTDSQHPLAFPFVIGFLIYIFIVIIYFIISTAVKLKSISGKEKAKIVGKWALYFVLLTAVLYVLGLFIEMPNKGGGYGNIAIPFGLTLGMMFYELWSKGKTKT